MLSHFVVFDKNFNYSHDIFVYVCISCYITKIEQGNDLLPCSRAGRRQIMLTCFLWIPVRMQKMTDLA